jgi:lambda family phage portal protein
VGLATKLDRLVSSISPSWGRSRAADRLRQTLIERGADMLGGGELATRRYAGASVGDRTSTWVATGSSSNTEISQSLELLRARSRQLVRDDGWAAAAVRRIVSNAIGDGLRCTVEHPDEAVRREAQELWDRWAESTECDADGRLDFAGLQGLALRGAIEGGDTLARRRWRLEGAPHDLPFQVQLLEGDYLDTTRDSIARTPEGTTIFLGIERDTRGRRVAYHLFKEHPGEYGWLNTLQSVRVEAQHVAHVYRLERAGQLRGVPWGAPVVLLARMFGSWKDASLYRAQAAACLVAIVNEMEPDQAESSGNPTGFKPESLTPGSIIYTQGAQSVSLSSPPGVQGMDSFSKLLLLEYASAYGLTYEALTGDLSRTNYSSGRMGWLEMARELRVWRRDVLIRTFCDRVFRWFVEAAVLAGKLRDDGRFRASWTPPRREFVDAAKEIQGIVAEIRAGLTTWSEAARELGWSVEELIAEYQRDLAMRDAAGLPMFDSDPRRAASGGAAAKDDAEGDDEDEDGDEKKDGE